MPTLKGFEKYVSVLRRRLGNIWLMTQMKSIRNEPAVEFKS